MANLTTRTKEPELDFGKLFHILRRGRKTVRNFTAGFLFVALVYAQFWPRTYQAVNTVKVPDSSQTTTNAIREMAFLPSSGDPIETYMQVAEADKVAAGVIAALKLKDRPKFKGVSDQKLIWSLKKQIRIDNVKRSNLISVQAQAKTAVDAAELANAWAQSFIEVSRDLGREAEEARYEFIHGQLQTMREKLAQDTENKKNYLNPSNEVEANELTYKSLLEQDQESKIRSNNVNTGIVVVDPAAIPDKAVSPKKISSVALGLIAGLFIGILSVFGRERMEDRIYEESDLALATQKSLWAEIPTASGQKAGNPPAADLLISQPQLVNSAYSRSFKTLRSSLILENSEAKPLAFALFSPGRGEGRTSVTANLALSLAQAGKKVLLVDIDLENPRAGALFGIEAPAVSGLSRLLSGQATLKEVLKPAGNGNLMVLSTPAISTDPAGIWGSGSMKKLAGELKQKFEYVLFDAPPLLSSPDLAVLSMALDGVVLLARYGQTRRAEVEKAVKQIQTAHTPLWGTVLNGVAEDKVTWGDFLGPWGQKGMDRLGRIPEKILKKG